MIVETNSLRKRSDSTYTLERNLLGIPTFVLSERSSKKKTVLEHCWETDAGSMRFRFLRTDITPFPLVQHARYFDALVGLFSTRWNEDGDLWFSISEVLTYAGMNARNRGARQSVLEAIKRYKYCLATWENSWKGRTSSWSSPFIISDDIWDEDQDDLKRNPRRSRGRVNLHRLRFNPHIVCSLKDKNIRVFLKESIKKLNSDSYAVYRYFFGFSDQSTVHRDLDTLQTVFPWSGRKSRFETWLTDRLNECFEKGFLSSFEIKDNRVFVTCKSMSDIKDNVIQLEVSDFKKKKPKSIALKRTQASDESILEEYFRRKTNGDVPSELALVVDSLISKNMTKYAVDCLRNRL